MTIFDWIIFLIVALSAIVSFFRGVLKESLSLIVWIVAAWMGLSYSKLFAANFLAAIPNANIRIGIAFSVIFILVLLAGAIFGFLMTFFIERTGLSWIDRLLGMGFGFARGVLVVALLLLIGRMTSLPLSPAWGNSKLIPMFASVEMVLQQYVETYFGDVVIATNTQLQRAKSEAKQKLQQLVP